ncbi:MAG: DNA replication protein psf2 [Vezdaea aestivalis]|nr:MAG: DNA replication protein psf2 [Vezdaea aestivalis]
MAHTLPRGLTPSEVAFLCEMEMVTVVPRQRLDGLELLGGPTQPLQPPHRATLPLWLALLLKRQKRANIFPPPWLHPSALEAILNLETNVNPTTFSPPPPPLPASSGNPAISPPFTSSSTAFAFEDYLPYHWLELGEMLLDAASDDVVDPGQVRRLLRDLREVRMAKMRAGVAELDGRSVVELKGVGAMEVAEGRAFVSGVVDGLRKIGAGREIKAKEELEQGGAAGDGVDDDDMDYD